MIGKSLEDYWRTIGGSSKNQERNPPSPSGPRSLRFHRRSAFFPAALNAHSRAIFASVNAPTRRHIVEP
nr:MAG TPA: hypothetical protein [Caudoviricetes sp.]